MKRLALTGLIKIEFPDHTLRLCDGGFIVWDGETYRDKDAVFGTVGSVEPLSEGVGEEVPALELKLLPPGTTAVADLVQPGFQASRARFWIGEYDPETGLLDGEPGQQFDGQVDQAIVNIGRGALGLALTIVGNAKRLLESNLGNSLNPTWHRLVWPGEGGHDQATGLGRPVAWGVESPPAAASGGTWWKP